MRGRPAIAATFLFGLILLAGYCASTDARDRGLPDHEPIDLLEQSEASGEQAALSSTVLSSAALADSCRANPGPDCQALITATCWDGDQGLTQYACLTTPADGSWRRLPEVYDVPARYFQASATGTHLILDRLVTDSNGDSLDSARSDLREGQRWFRAGDLLMQEVDGVVEIARLDGTVVETIGPPPPYLGTSSFRWTSWALSHDRSKIVVMSGIETTEVWLHDRNEQTWSLLQDDDRYLYFPLVTGLGFSADDRTVITARVARDDDGSRPIRQWWIVAVDVESGSLRTLREVNTEGGIHTSVSPAGTLVALANTLSETRILNLETQEVSDRVIHCCHEPLPDWSPNGRFLVTDRGFLIEVVDATIPLANGPYDLRPPDPEEVRLPLVRFQASKTS